MSFPISDRMKSLNPSAVREIFKYLSDPAVISFAGGNPSEATFPSAELARISAGMYDENPAAFLQYGISEGYGPLREITKKRMSEKYGVGGENDDIIITTGGQQGIDLVLKTLTNEGDTLISEDPSFIGALNDIRSYGLNIVGVPVDDQGMDMDALETALKTEKNVKVIYTIPTNQNPTGVTMPLERRKRMYELAVKYNVAILEDSPYFELNYKGEAPACIKSLDKTGHVIFCGSYSKVVSPGLRVAYLILDKEIMPKLTVAKQCADVHTPVYPQMLIARYLEGYDFDAHISDNCRIYSRQLDRMLGAMDRAFGQAVRYTRPRGGLFIWCYLPEGKSGNDFCTAAIKRKVACVPGSAFDAAGRDINGIRLNFSMPTIQQIDTGIDILADCLKEFLD